MLQLVVAATLVVYTGIQVDVNPVQDLLRSSAVT
jgi:hypothetical protein